MTSPTELFMHRYLTPKSNLQRLNIHICISNLFLGKPWMTFDDVVKDLVALVSLCRFQYEVHCICLNGGSRPKFICRVQLLLMCRLAK